jgi:hypothetical protein
MGRTTLRPHRGFFSSSVLEVTGEEVESGWDPDGGREVAW